MLYIHYPCHLAVAKHLKIVKPQEEKGTLTFIEWVDHLMYLISCNSSKEIYWVHILLLKIWNWHSGRLIPLAREILWQTWDWNPHLRNPTVLPFSSGTTPRHSGSTWVLMLRWFPDISMVREPYAEELSATCAWERCWWMNAPENQEVREKGIPEIGNSMFKWKGSWENAELCLNVITACYTWNIVCWEGEVELELRLCPEVGEAKTQCVWQISISVGWHSCFPF